MQMKMNYVSYSYWLNWDLVWSSANHGLPKWCSGKESTANAGNAGSIPGLGRFTGEGNGNPFQCSCLGNSMDRGAWQATVYGCPKELDRTSEWWSRHPPGDQSRSPQNCWHQMLWALAKEVQLHWLLQSPGNTVTGEDLEKCLGLNR